MAAKKQNKYIGQTIEWLKYQIEQQQAYVDANPIASLTDRKGTRIVKGQPQEYVIEKKEKIRQDLMLAIREVAEMTAVIENLEKEEETKKQLIRGDDELTPLESDELKEE